MPLLLTPSPSWATHLLNRAEILEPSMRRILACALGMSVALLASPAFAQPSMAQDLVLGTGSTGLPFPVFFNIVIDARSDPSGGNPSGSVSFDVADNPFQSPVSVGGPVTCLGVSGNRAVIGFNDVTFGLGPITVEVIDSPDTFGALASPTDCLGDPDINPDPLVSGNIFVHDAQPTPSTKDDCKNGGWRNFADDQGEPFGNQGLCERFVLRPIHPV
jgi:hypothetical protein